MWHPGERGTVRSGVLALACALPLLAGCAAPAVGPGGADPAAAGGAFTPRGQSWEAGPAGEGARESQAAALGDPRQRAVLHAVDRYWAEVQRATADPRPGDPGLASVATGSALGQWRTRIGRLAAKKLRYAGTVEQRVKVGAVAERTATARGCVDASAWTVVDATGTRVAKPKPPTRYRYRLVAAGAGWKVSAVALGGPCSLDAP